jgi:hypothetical protein
VGRKNQERIVTSAISTAPGGMTPGTPASP